MSAEGIGLRPRSPVPTMPERVVSAAMLMTDDYVIPGVRHYSPDMRFTLRRLYGPDYSPLVREQGFITNKGRYVTREEAWIIAEREGQLRRRTGNEGTLYSEDLY